MRAPRCVVVRGDGIGPEVVDGALEVLAATGAALELEEAEAGYGAWRRTGHTAPRATLDAIRAAGLCLKGPFHTPSGGDVRSANYYIRRELDLYACHRPIRARDGSWEVALVRENVEDLYAAIEWSPAPGVAQAAKVATRAGCERIARYAFGLARAQGRRRVTVVHKANNLKLTEGMFLDVAREVAAEFPEVQVDDMIADTACGSMAVAPETFDVVLASNTFGDLLSSIGGAAAGSLGTLASANHGNGVLVTEAAHGSADALAGTGRANPLAMIGALELLLEGMRMPREAAAVRAAVREACRSGAVTPDMGGTATTGEVVAEVRRRAARTLALPAAGKEARAEAVPA